jgi:hypothetical protein
MIGAAFKVNIDAIGNREYAYIGVLQASEKKHTVFKNNTIKLVTNYNY